RRIERRRRLRDHDGAGARLGSAAARLSGAARAVRSRPARAGRAHPVPSRRAPRLSRARLLTDTTATEVRSRRAPFAWLADGYLGALTLIGILWVAGFPRLLDTTWLDGQLLPVFIGLATAAALLRVPYGPEPRLLDAALGALALGCWLWSA